MRAILVLACLLSVPAPGAWADDDLPPGARPLGAQAALACVAARYRGEALRLRDREDGFLWEVRWLTPAGNVLRIDLTGPGCRFLEVDGVGQVDARILPGQTR